MDATTNTNTSTKFELTHKTPLRGSLSQAQGEPPLVATMENNIKSYVFTLSRPCSLRSHRACPHTIVYSLGGACLSLGGRATPPNRAGQSPPSGRLVPFLVANKSDVQAFRARARQYKEQIPNAKPVA